MTAMPETTGTRTVDHATFVIERTLEFPVARVFNAWADRDTKRRWFASPDENASSVHELDQLEAALRRESEHGADSPRARLS